MTDEQLDFALQRFRGVRLTTKQVQRIISTTVVPLLISAAREDLRQEKIANYGEFPG